MKVHQVAYSSKNDILNFRSLLCFASILCQHYDLGTAFEYSNKSSVSFADNSKTSQNADQLNIGNSVQVEYEDNLYPGKVKTLCSESVTVDVMVLARRGKYKWPSPKDIHNYTRADIKRKILQQIPCDNRASQFYFPNL
ncbi:hypothetical protein AVEN_267370-1 [Araneus ventricosus]|uniref:Uncharacterized protein n=1 Tax=Araneus ventricosus TaxID=182803 RepID=A0A4Y2TH40_ARAVE|nr:hypothetical protein AVEN_267370-1 [Araneus ventricosus]